MEKKIITSLFVILLVSISYSAGVTNYGKVVYLENFTPDYPGVSESHIVFQLEGVDNSVTSNCPHSDLGNGDLTKFAFEADNKTFLSILLTAYTTGEILKVNSDPVDKLESLCKARRIGFKK